MALQASFSEFQKTVIKIGEKKELVECNSTLCTDVSDRLSALFEVVKDRGDEDKQCVVDALLPSAADLLYKMRFQIHNAFSLYLLAWSHRFVDSVWKVHEKVTAVYNALGLVPDMTDREWHENVLGGRRVQQDWLERKFSSFTGTSRLVGETPPRKLESTLLTMEVQLKVRFDENAEGAASVNTHVQMNPEIAQLMQNTINLIKDENDRPHTELAMVYDWHIDKECIEIRENQDLISEGTFGSVYKATMTNLPSGKKRVAVKKLDKNLEGIDVDSKFYRELEIWITLRKDKHILEFMGANHASSPKFFVMEYASEGNLEQFFRDPDTNNRKLLWHMLGQAAEGLKVLHSGDHPVEHGGLKTTNLLLTKDDSGELVVKISDFGMSFIRTSSLAVSRIARDDSSLWQAPERLKDYTNRTGIDKADIYCLGLCVIDAATGQPPFAGLDADRVVENKFDDVRIEHPGFGFSDEEWAFVDQMCDPDPANRPSLDMVIERMAELDNIRQKRWPVGFPAAPA